MKRTLKIILFNPDEFSYTMMGELIKGLPLRALGCHAVKTIKIVETNIPVVHRKEKI